MNNRIQKVNDYRTFTTPTPGFEVVFAIIGLLAAACALLFGRKYK